MKGMMKLLDGREGVIYRLYADDLVVVARKREVTKLLRDMESNKQNNMLVDKRKSGIMQM